MVATHVLISLCVAGLAAAAPQLDLPGVQRTATAYAGGVNQEALVTDVVTALEPSIAAAVANALRSLTATTYASNQKASSAKLAGATAATAEPTARPEYNFEFKVADNEDQTYITQQEARDGDELTGSYSYVDPTGALITVNYQAGPDGFSQTSDKKEGFVEIRAKPTTRVAPTAAVALPLVKAAPAPAPAIDQSALIAQIIAALQPQIASSVSSALAASQRAAVVAAPAVQAVARSGDVSSLFGEGYAVRIATPEFNIQY
jgi:hypothetical protein